MAPDSEEQIVELLHLASEHRLPIVPMGRGSAFWLGNPVSEPPLLLSTERFNAIVDYEPRDLTGVFQAGASLQSVQDLVNSDGLFLALDPPHAYRVTIGGLTATNFSGPLRAKYGTHLAICAWGCGRFCRTGAVSGAVAGWSRTSPDTTSPG
ncbi:MAG: hypothetical protein KatS3mg115_2205 [Candidatus Poribacteria bacterium]|nr:MAG: hypothetical protein KatS3mg115_2205 [Candidatus Poribacteria bacterium]